MNKHEFDCPIILDLLPLSLENLVSKETEGILQAHLLSCDNCRQTYLSMGKDLDFLCRPQCSAQCSPQTRKKRKNHHFKRKSRLHIFLLGYILFLLLVLVWVFCGLR